MFESAYAMEANRLGAAAGAASRRFTQFYGRSELADDEHSEVVMHDDSEFADDEHTEVVEDDAVTKKMPGAYRDYLMMAVISLNLAAFGVVLFVSLARP